MDLLQSLILPLGYARTEPQSQSKPRSIPDTTPTSNDIPTYPPTPAFNPNPTNEATSHPDISAAAFEDLEIQTLAQWQASRAARVPASNPNRLSASNNTSTSVLAVSPSGNHAAPSLTSATTLPTPLGGPRTTHSIQTLYQLCQPRGLTPEFSFQPLGQRWTVSLQVAGKTVTAEGSYASKMEGKEVCAREGVEIVRAVGVRGDVVEGEGNVDGGGGVGLKRLGEENWIGLVLEYSNAHSSPPPIYQDFSHGPNGQSFSTTLHLPSLPSAPVFGSASKPYNSKKTAKAAASMDAVVWLREQGLLPPEGGPVRKKARMSSSSSVVAASSPKGKINVDDDDTGDTTSSTAAREVVNLCTILGLEQPTYKLDQANGGLALYSGAAFFEKTDVRQLKGPLGEVYNVFGRKNAKEEVARAVVKVLRGVVEERLRGV